MAFEDPSYSSADSLRGPNPFLDASARVWKNIEWEIFQTNLWRQSKRTIYDEYFFPENPAVYEIMLKSVIESDTP